MPETPHWPTTGPVSASHFHSVFHHARLATVATFHFCDHELQKPCCPVEPYLMTNLVVALLTGAGYKDLLEKQGAAAARHWLEHAFGIVASEIEATTGQRMRITFEVRDAPDGG